MLELRGSPSRTNAGGLSGGKGPRWPNDSARWFRTLPLPLCLKGSLPRKGAKMDEVLDCRVEPASLDLLRRRVRLDLGLDSFEALLDEKLARAWRLRRTSLPCRALMKVPLRSFQVCGHRQDAADRMRLVALETRPANESTNEGATSLCLWRLTLEELGALLR